MLSRWRGARASGGYEVFRFGAVEPSATRASGHEARAVLPFAQVVGENRDLRQCFAAVKSCMDWERIIDTTAPEDLSDALLEATHYPTDPALWQMTRYHWLRAYVPQSVLALALERMMTALAPVNGAADDSPEGRLADRIRDAADWVAYALDADRRR